MNAKWIQIGNRYLNERNIVDVTVHEDVIIITMSNESDWRFSKENTPVEYEKIKKWLTYSEMIERDVITKDEETI